MLAGSASRPAGRGEMGGDLAAQFRQPLRRRIAGDVARQRFQHAGGATRPGLLGEQVGRRNAACQQRAKAGVAGGGGGGNGGEALAAPGQRTRGGRRRHGRCGRGVRQVGSDVGAAAGAGADIALGGEPLIGQHHRLARHTQFLGQRAGRRQAGTGRQVPTRIPCRSRSNTACWRFWSGKNIEAGPEPLVQSDRSRAGAGRARSGESVPPAPRPQPSSGDRQKPSRSSRLRSSLRARRTASAASRARRSDGFS